MGQTCHICESTVTLDESDGDDEETGFICYDCEQITCYDCLSIGVAREHDHCKKCRG
jgi:hypothetical protein